MPSASIASLPRVSRHPAAVLIVAAPVGSPHLSGRIGSEPTVSQSEEKFHDSDRLVTDSATYPTERNFTPDIHALRTK